METLWLALHLPQLSLDIHPAPSSSASAGKAVIEHNRIAACDPAALAAGVRPWMKPALARSLLPTISLLPRDAAAETALLENLACWAGTYTPRIRVVPQLGLLLEIGCCLRLFGGFERLHGAIVAGLAAQGCAVRSAAAPVARGALWLALAGDDGIRVDADELPVVLDALSLAALEPELEADCIARLGSFGVADLGAARRLPAAALTRRVGTGAMLQLARAYGEMPDTQPDFVFPEQFAQGLELPVPVENAEALLFAGRRLVQALAGWLTSRQAGMRGCTLTLTHRRQAATQLQLNFAEALRDGVRIEAVLRERLPRLELGAPVETLRLSADAIVDLPGQSRPLFRREGAQPDGMAALTERLRARLGDARVHGYALVADHRPECVSAPAAAGSGGVPPDTPPRPLYLLPTPQALAEREGRPQCEGPLLLLSGPERIESGWWDQGESNADGRPTGDLRRDYFVALTPGQRWLWVYRDAQAWFLHGYFS